MPRPNRVRLVFNPPNEAWFYVQLRGGWTAVYRLTPRDGRPVVAELRVLPSPVNTKRDNGEPLGGHEIPGDGLTAAILKDEVVIGQHIYNLLPAFLRQTRRGVGAAPVGVGGRTLFDTLVGPLSFDLERKPQRTRRGPKGWPDEDYARLAADYVRAWGSGSHSPAVDVAKVYGMKVSAVRAALNRARKRGLLTPGTGGRAGGQLTPRAKALLRPASQESK